MAGYLFFIPLLLNSNKFLPYTYRLLFWTEGAQESVKDMTQVRQTDGYVKVFFFFFFFFFFFS